MLSLLAPGSCEGLAFGVVLASDQVASEGRALAIRRGGLDQRRFGRVAVVVGEKFYGSTGTLETTAPHNWLPMFETAEDESNEWPLVSIILPTWCEEPYLERCLDSIVNQSYPLQRLEIFVVDGMSPDGTRQIVRRYANDYPQIRLIDNQGRLQAAGLNKGIQCSNGSIIVRMDAHCEYARDYVLKCVKTLKEKNCDNVGGPQRPKARTFFQKMVSIALSSKLGTGGAAYRHGRDGYVDTVFLGAFRREAFRRVGLFDPGAITNEDAEINQRIIATGGRIYLNSEIECYYYPRDKMRALAVQYFRYGRGRARTFLKHKHIMRLGSFIPFLFVFSTLLLLVFGTVWPLALTLGLGALASYAGGILLESLRLATRNDWRCAAVLPAIFATEHFSHALGVAYGLVYYAFNPDWHYHSPPQLVE